MVDVKVKVEYTEGYEKRFTLACIKQLEKRKKAVQLNLEGKCKNMLPQQTA